MFTFGNFNHELDYILKKSFKSSVFSPRLLINGKCVSTVVPKTKINLSIKGWNNISVSETNSATIKYFGIHNYENCCFLNASLQVMLNSNDFIKSLNTYDLRTSGQSTVIETINQYRSGIKSSVVTLKTNKSDDCITYYGKKVESINPCLSLISLLGFTKNQHEDAEEFLTKLLTQMHEELLKCVIDIRVNEITSETSTDDEWVEIGRGGKNMSPPREDGGDMSSETVLSQLVAGKITEKVNKKGKTQNATITPFFILPLNIQSNNINDVVSALKSLTEIDKLSDLSERQMQISQLPTMLIIQLKRFTYTKGVGVEKIMRHIEINDSLSIPTECLHPTIIDLSHLSYKLYAVVFHIGEGVTKGHYTAAVRDGTDNTWIYMDDSDVMRVQGRRSTEWLMDSNSADIPSHLLSLDLQGSAPRRSCVNGPRTPYLLFYTRL